jgi:hypothetical protein
MGGLSEGGLLEEPGGMVAFFPFGEVSLADGASGEGGGQDLQDLGIGIEPDDDGFAGLAVAQAGVDLLANMMGQAGDFTIGSFFCIGRLTWIDLDWVGLGGRRLRLGAEAVETLTSP